MILDHLYWFTDPNDAWKAALLAVILGVTMALAFLQFVKPLIFKAHTRENRHRPRRPRSKHDKKSYSEDSNGTTEPCPQHNTTPPPRESVNDSALGSDPKLVETSANAETSKNGIDDIIDQIVVLQHVAAGQISRLNAMKQANTEHIHCLKHRQALEVENKHLKTQLAKFKRTDQKKMGLLMKELAVKRKALSHLDNVLVPSLSAEITQLKAENEKLLKHNGHSHEFRDTGFRN